MKVSCLLEYSLIIFTNLKIDECNFIESNVSDYYFLFCELSSIKIINSNIKLFSDIITLSSNFIISNSYSNIYK